MYLILWQSRLQQAGFCALANFNHASDIPYHGISAGASKHNSPLCLPLAALWSMLQEGHVYLPTQATINPHMEYQGLQPLTCIGQLSGHVALRRRAYLCND